MSKVGNLVKFAAKSGKREELVEHFRTLLDVVNTENGTQNWAVHISPIEPDAVWLYEIYTDQAAMDLHDSTEIMTQAKLKTQELTQGRPEVFPLIPIVGKGLIS
jgi:quinol monooxygenase YgiN